MKTLGGVMFIRNGETYDYNYLEAMACLEELCDSVVVLDAGSTDDTLKQLHKNKSDKTMLIACNEWDSQQGREKLAYFQNMALSFLDTDYYFLLQGDEILHEYSFDAVRAIIETGVDAAYCTRINLWRDADSFIDVPENRQPCSTQVIRLAKTNYKSHGDGESIQAAADSSFLKELIIFHYGFVRRKEVMKDKIINMQEGVFRIPHDPKLDGSEIFNSELWFSGDELSPLEYPHPKFIKEWIKTRP